MIRFGPSGNSESFYAQGYTSSLQMPAWLKQRGLNAYEYQCGKGVGISEKTARALGEEAKQYDIFMSIHGPYYISMSSVDEEKRKNSIRYILESMQAAQWMNAHRVVIHTGSCAGIDRGWALETAKTVLKEALAEADAAGLGNITLCPEVLGKINQLGTLEEIISMCQVDDRLIPTIDFGHLHARGMGCLQSQKDFRRVMDQLENGIGYDRLKVLHCHFSRIEYTKGGEKRHWTYEDTQFGPDFDPLAEEIFRRGLEPVIISESRGKMAEDALKMKQIYLRLEKGDTI